MTPLQLRARLYARDETVSSWARDRGYDPGTVNRVLHRWGSHRGHPRGRLTRSILRDLSLDLGIAIPPGIDWAAAEAVAAKEASASPCRRVAGIKEE